MKTNRWMRRGVAAVVILLGWSGVVSAAEYAVRIDGSAVRASENGNYDGDTTKMTDGSGMNGNGNNDDGDLLRWPYDYTPGDPSTWTNTSQDWHADYQATAILSGATNGKIGWITFDLGASYLLENLYFWNTENNASAGISNFNLYVATAAVGIPSTWNQDYSFDAGNGWTQYGDDDADPTTARYFMPIATALPASYTTNINVSGTTARYIGLEVFGSWGNASRFGLAEIAVTIIDNTAPTLAPADIADDAGGSVDVYNPVTYTVTFSEEIDTSSMTTGECSNAGTSDIVVDSVTQTATNVFEVIVTPTTTGSLQLRVSSNVSDWAGLTLAGDVDDANTITVGADAVAPTASVVNALSSPLTTLDATVRYTFTFNEYMDTNTFATGDFSNLSNTSFTVESITAGANDSVVLVDVTVEELGYLHLQLDSGSVSDMSGNATDQAWSDGVAIEVIDPELVIYEPFGDSDTTLTGNSSGMGLSGTWSASTGYTNYTNLVYGDLITASNAVSVYNGWSQAKVNLDTSTDEFKALLSNGSQLWFSMIYSPISGGRFQFGIQNCDFFNNGDLANAAGNQSVGFGYASTKRLYAGLHETYDWGPDNLGTAPWSAVDPNQYASVTNGSLVLVVGHVEWGVDDATDDTVSLYLPDTEMVLGSPVAVSAGIVDQSTFNKMRILNGNSLTSLFDEIRVGATYADVIPVPPPAGTVFFFK